MAVVEQIGRTGAGASAVRRRLHFLGRPRAREAISAYVFLLPTLLGMLTLSLGATIASFGISFSEWSITKAPRFIGLANYDRMFGDPLFWKSLGNTSYYVFGTALVGIPAAILVAVAMNQKVRGIGLFRTAFFLPVVSSMVAVALLWSWLYAPDFGLFNWLLGRLGLPAVPWLSNPKMAMPSIMIMTIWKYVGYDATIFLAGLQTVPEEMYEAGRIDGASSLGLFRHITIPMISPVIFFVVVLSFINSYQIFAETYIMTNGGPLFSTTTLVLYIFQWGFKRFAMGYASALAYALFVIILTLTVIQLKFESKWVHYD